MPDQDSMKDSVKNKTVRTCYEHLGGKLGELLLLYFVREGWLVEQNAAGKNYSFTEKGAEGFLKMGIDLSSLK